MQDDRMSHRRITAVELEEFLKTPPEGFRVETVGSCHLVTARDDQNIVFIDDFDSSCGRIVFQNSLGREVKMKNLGAYTSMRKSLLSKKIHLMVSTCEQKPTEMNQLDSSESRVLKFYVVSINGGDPFIRWQMEKGLDWTISSVTGESYSVIIDLSEALDNLAAEGLISEDLVKHKPGWKDASFSLKYCSDALFDFPYWFGFSKRTFKLRLTKTAAGEENS